jgi:hypothetical protein
MILVMPKGRENRTEPMGWWFFSGIGWIIRGMRIIALPILMLISAQPIHAYLDQGTGSMVVQIVAAAVFGGIFFIKSFWRRTIRFCKSIIPQKKKSDV